MPTEKREHIGFFARATRGFNHTIIFEDRPYTWHSDVDMTQGDLIHVDVEGDAIDNDHLKYVGHETDRGVKNAVEFNHAVAGPVKNGKLVIARDKVMGEQSDHIGVYTLATKEEFDAMKPKVKAQVTCPNYLAFVGAAVAVEEVANDDAVEAAMVIDMPDITESEDDAEPLVLGDDQRIDNDPAP